MSRAVLLSASAASARRHRSQVLGRRGSSQPSLLLLGHVRVISSHAVTQSLRLGHQSIVGRAEVNHCLADTAVVMEADNLSILATLDGL